MKELEAGRIRKEIIIVDDDFNIDVSTVLFHVQGLTILKIENGKKKYHRLKNLVMKNEDIYKTKYKHKNGNKFDFRRENLTTGISINNIPQMYQKKYMGIAITNRELSHGGYYLAVKNHKNKRYNLMAKNEYEAAQKYNAICDYLEIDCYRNKVEKIELTKKEIKKLEECKNN